MSETHSAWCPGLESDIPVAYRSLESIYNPRNVTSSIEEVDELSRQTGLSPPELVVFRPERLALHEMIVRISAEILVQEGESEIALGSNFRQIAGTIWSQYIAPHSREISEAYAALRTTVALRVQQELQQTLFRVAAPIAKRRGVRAWFARRPADPRPTESIEARENRALAHFRQQGRAATDPLDKALFRSLYRLLGALVANRGYIGPDRARIASLVCDHVCNSYGSELIGSMIDKWIASAISEQEYDRIPSADAPILISLKGASAAGKSSLRPMLKRMMREQEVESNGYITISPDIWRRLLLDYNALGEAYKYAGRMTSYELIAIDGKLDQYIRDKADRLGAMPHLLVDRFRFDSFSTERIARILHDTYVRHVGTLYIYFVVAPPTATVERGWQRGLETGRYKAVEDFLDHSVEAYTGMPKVLFRWLAYQSPRFRYRFLDNSVPKGTFPRTVAYGDQKEMTILDCRVLVDIERYQKINIHARCAEEIYLPGTPLGVTDNLGFLRQCLKAVPLVRFKTADNGEHYLECRNGTFRVTDRKALAAALADDELQSILQALEPTITA